MELDETLYLQEELDADEFGEPNSNEEYAKAMLAHPLMAAKPPKRRWFESSEQFRMRVEGLLGVRAMIHIMDMRQEEDDLRQAIRDADDRIVHRESGRHGYVIEMEHGFATVVWDDETNPGPYVPLDGIDAASGAARSRQ